MATTSEQTWELFQAAEKDLQAALAERVPLQHIDHSIIQYRSTSEAILLQDFQFALEKHVEERLWEAHVRINNRFRKQLSVFREVTAKKRQVEQRKAIKQYLEFIKSSQRFYRGYIRNLAFRFGGIQELDDVARKFNLDTTYGDNQVLASGDLSHEILRSCHQTLVHLGDLSRYRETELAPKKYNWGPATGYYDLATAIYPASGASHNQLAVIARVDANHLRATYHLYRALAVEEPHETAKGNLELEFKKIHTAWDKGELIINTPNRDIQKPGKALVGWFMRLHARCYNGIDFVEHDELESEVLSQLAIDLKERSLEGTLNKFILINISAEHFAAKRLRANRESLIDGESPDSSVNRDSPELLQSFLFFQRLNVKTMFTLLQVLQPELECLASAEDELATDNTEPIGLDQISAVARRVLPGLRHYSSWLTSNTALLVYYLQRENSLSVQVKELWKIYASTLTLLASTFSVSSLPCIEYLLEEDEDTLGFKPFENERAVGRYYLQDPYVIKPKWHSQGVERHHPNVEMAGRIRDFIVEGLKLAVDESIPMDLVLGSTTFTFREEGMPSELQASPMGHQATLSSTTVERQEISDANGAPQLDMPSPADKISQAAFSTNSMNTEANRMVDNLVDSEPAEKDDNRVDDECDYIQQMEPTPLAPAFEFFPSGEVDDTSYGFSSNLYDSDIIRVLHENSQQKQIQSTPRPHLPSIYDPAFAPETTPNSRPTTAKRLSPHHSQRNSLHTFPLQQHLNTYAEDSTISSMPDPSSHTGPQTPTNGYRHHYKNNTIFAGAGFEAEATFGAIGQPVFRRNEKTCSLESEFQSSKVLEGSTWCSAQSIHNALNFQTPPNGQGTG